MPDEKIPNDDFAREIALRLLTVRARTRFELSEAFKNRAVPEEVGGRVLDRLEDVGLIDDLSFAKSWVMSNRSRTRSVFVLKQELRQKGVSDDWIEEVFSELSVDRELEAALEVARKKWASVSSLPQEVQYRRLAGAISRRGFSPQICREAISQIRAEMV